MSIPASIGEYLINLPQRLVRRATRPLPHRWQVAIAGGVLRTLIPGIPSLRRRADANLLHVFPDMPPGERAAIIRAMADRFGRTLIEIFHSPQMFTRQRDFRVTGPGYEALRQAAMTGRGAVLISGHFGNWEAVRSFMKGRGMECSGLYRAQNNRFFDDDFLPKIEFTGSPIFPKTRAGMVGFVKHIRNGGFTAILMDQRTNGGEVLDFLGRPALTSTFVAEVAIKRGALIVPAYGIRDENGCDMTILLEAPIEGSDARAVTQALNDSLAEQVRQRPEQYYWLHRRWAGADGRKQPDLP